MVEKYVNYTEPETLVVKLETNVYSFMTGPVQPMICFMKIPGWAEYIEGFICYHELIID